MFKFIKLFNFSCNFLLFYHDNNHRNHHILLLLLLLLLLLQVNRMKFNKNIIIFNKITENNKQEKRKSLRD